MKPFPIIHQRVRTILAILPSTVTPVAVTKGRTVQEMKAAIGSGVLHIGESRVQEAAKKFPDLQNQTFTKHLIGHLQSNKAKRAVELFDVVQSIDSKKAVQKINHAAAQQNKTMQGMIQVNIGNEQQKHGVSAEHVIDFYQSISHFSHLRIIGLMCIAPDVPAEQTRPFFQQMAVLNNTLQLPHLSMGMSNDYQVAIQEGSTMIRLGRAIFG